ncbi:MAG: bifunctional folylpolyglutamate synthase/dihydrofolate synthase [Gammaproteobacteria bacterium]|nr:bifunctional folylpolyglutamate synthase/dihydrofolate synthase [Gammaproteobacteria bacterium]
MRFESLDQWLEWQMVLHDKAIELGLDRVGQVGERLGIGEIARQVITVAGTNGKGSSVAAYENWLHQAGFAVASYTSPHLLSYNERIKRNLEPVSDAELCNAFEAVESARQGVSLTYFEFGTLAALFLMQQWQPDYAILEVGLGGRLDAVNIIDADLVHLTPIGLDHQAWLGDDREQIGFEKAGVLRAGIAVVLNDPDPPRSVSEEINRLGCNCLQLGRDFEARQLDDGQLLWRCRDIELRLDNVLSGSHQAQNLAGVVAGLSQLSLLDKYEPNQVRQFFHGTRLEGRLQLVETPLACQLYVDVGHNQDAARALAASIATLKQPSAKVVVLLGMLADKEPELFVEALKPVVDCWWLLTLDADRGLEAAQLASRIESQVAPERLFVNITNALDHALSSLGNQDIMLVTGSFVTVEYLLRAVSYSGQQK